MFCSYCYQEPHKNQSILVLILFDIFINDFADDNTVSAAEFSIERENQIANDYWFKQKEVISSNYSEKKF